MLYRDKTLTKNSAQKSQTFLDHSSGSIHVQNLEVIEDFLEFLLIIKGIYLSPVTKLTKNALPPARLIVTHFQ